LSSFSEFVILTLSEAEGEGALHFYRRTMPPPQAFAER
jgi:hypothetical protein